MTSEKMAWLIDRLKEYFTSFPRAAYPLGHKWECSQGALRRESRPTSCLYGTQRVRHGIPTQRVGTRNQRQTFRTGQHASSSLGTSAKRICGIGL